MTGYYFIKILSILFRKCIKLIPYIILFDVTSYVMGQYDTVRVEQMIFVKHRSYITSHDLYIVPLLVQALFIIVLDKQI